ncbi:MULTISPECIES: sugar phosphate isomerase/epimerase family protein [unclassified Paenibacillus]|uniref:sugar phosphate isomerase/epimerase family protein n=1 Tax=unclassified Paenibacillus TaxID=185978 RepID=UPI002F42B105
MTIGVLAHLMGRLPYKELAAKVASHDFKHVQLALWKAVSDIDFSAPGKLSPGLAMDIGEQFDRQGVSISVLGCYLHMFHRDEEQRRIHILRFKELLRHARYMGAPIVAFETGVNPSLDYTEQDWLVMKQVLEQLAEEAERWGVLIGIEAANDHLIGTAEQLASMLEEVPSSMLGVVMDAGNLLHEHNFSARDQVMEEAFALLGSRIIAAHAKDRIQRDDGVITTATAGKGMLNYELYMKLLNQYKPQVHLIMEVAEEQQMAETKAFLEQTRKWS